jgi:hypothetical protein
MIPNAALPKSSQLRKREYRKLGEKREQNFSSFRARD